MAAGILALALLAAPPAAAARSAKTPAIDEYVLDLPKLQRGVGGAEPTATPSAGAPAMGVTGERSATPSRLAVIGSAAISPAGLLLAVVAAIALVLALRPPRAGAR